ncbi:MAG TPA: response regulator transcription factor [Cellulomonas sp.]|uniref:response regulator transcription factor n=1 Tax=Cellulomonas sp. TaxID=40001 RepID=UPI002E368C89|nr:response regulator transcription factor [Cellulomonas sp.]HEX5331975.1 response regulator transcription factor [Cellulomonas sp.]
MTRILLVEDEESYRDPLTYQLTREGFDVVTAATGPEALVAWENGGADLVLLDLMLPGMSGTEVCRWLRARSDVPVIMLTAKDGEIDKVVGLEIGADDYVTKPYSFRELLARVRAVLRRGAIGTADAATEHDEGTLDVGPVRLDVERHTVHVHGELVAFPLKEFDLLELLMRNAGRVLTRGQLIDRVWGSDYVGDTKTLDVHVKRVRAKIESDPANPVLLQTVRGLGYKLADAAVS